MMVKRKVSVVKERNYIYNEHKECRKEIIKQMDRMEFLMQRMWHTLKEDKNGKA